MEAIVLAGGLGRRLREIVPDLPKPMAPVAGRPFLEILLQYLASNGFDRAVLSLGFMAETITNHFGSKYKGMNLSFIVEDHPLGTGGGVRLAFEQILSDHAYIFNGDTFLEIDTSALELSWMTSKSPIIVACSVPNTERYGRLLVDKGRVLGFSEKGIAGPGLINAGCYVLPRSELSLFQLGSPFSLEQDFFVPLVQQGLVEAFVTEGQFIDIGVPEDFYRAQTLLADLCGP